MRELIFRQLSVSVLLLSLAAGCATTGSDSGLLEEAPVATPASTPSAREASEISGMAQGGRIGEILGALENVRVRLTLPNTSDDSSLVADAQSLTRDLPDHPYPWLLLGIAHRVKGDSAAARDAFLRSLELDPDFEEAHLYLGWLAEEEGDLADAEAYFRKAWDINRNPDTLRPIAYMKLRQGQPDSARDMLAAVLEDHPQEREALNNMALAMDLTGRNREALALLKSLPGEAVEGSILETRALLELKEGRTDLAADDLEQRFNLGGPDPDTVLLLGILNLQRGNLKSAEGSFREVITSDKANPVAYLNLGLTLRRMGRFKEARTVYTRGILETNHPDIHLNLGVLFELYLGEPSNAIEHYRHYTQIEAGGAQRVGGWIDYLSGVVSAPKADREEGP